MPVYSIELRTNAGVQQILVMSKLPMSIEDFKTAYNDAYTTVSYDDSILTPTEELEAVVRELLKTGKFELPTITYAVVMDGELSEANHVENNIISYDEEFTGFTPEELDKMSQLFKQDTDGDNPCD